MKKIITTVIVVFVILLILLKFIPYGFKSGKTDIKVPRLSWNEQVTDDSITVTTTSSKLLLKIYMEALVVKYSTYTCRNTTMYYNKDKNLTINSYEIKSNGLFNTLTIYYNKGMNDQNYCSKVIDSKELSYRIKPPKRENLCHTPEKMHYNENGIKYTIYYSCFGDLLFKTGIEKMNYIREMLAYEWLSIQTITDFLEYQVEEEKSSKLTSQDNQNIAYINDSFSFIKCKRDNTNTDIFINNQKDIDIETFCKNEN